MRPPKLAEQHRDKLAPTRKPFRCVHVGSPSVWAQVGLAIHPYPTPLDDPTLFLFWTIGVENQKWMVNFWLSPHASRKYPLRLTSLFNVATIIMRFQFDPGKDRQNIASRGLSLIFAEQLLWDEALVWLDRRFHYHE